MLRAAAFAALLAALAGCGERAGSAPTTPRATALPTADGTASNGSAPGGPATIRPPLDRLVSLEADDAPLVEVLAEFSAQTGVPIEFDEAALPAPPRLAAGERATWRPTASARLRDVPLRLALRLVLAESEMEWAWQKGHVRVGDAMALPTSPFSTLAYPVSDILAEKGADWNEATLAELLWHSVDPQRWTQLGGRCHVRPAPGALLIAADAEQHARVERFLAALARLDPDGGPAEGVRFDADDPREELLAALAAPVSLEADGEHVGEVLDNLLVHWPGGVAMDPDLSAEPDRIAVRIADAPLAEALTAVLELSYCGWTTVGDTMVLGGGRPDFEDIVEEPEQQRLYPLLRSEGNGVSASEVIDKLTDTTVEGNFVGSYLTESAPGVLALPGNRDRHRMAAELLTTLDRLDDARVGNAALRDAREQAVAAALARPVSFDWRDEPLWEAATALLREQRVPHAFACDAWLRDVTISLSLRDVPLESALWLACELADVRELELAIRPQCVRLAGVIYGHDGQQVVAHRLPAASSPGHLQKFEWVVKTCLQPDEWDQVGGPGGAAGVAHGIVVRHSPPMQRRVRAFLAAWQTLADGDGPAAVRVPVSPHAERILAELDRPLHFAAPPPVTDEMARVVRMLAEGSGLVGQLVADWDELESEFLGGVAKHEIPAPQPGMTLRQALDHCLPRQVACTLRHDALVIDARQEHAPARPVELWLHRLPGDGEGLQFDWKAGIAHGQPLSDGAEVAEGPGFLAVTGTPQDQQWVARFVQSMSGDDPLAYERRQELLEEMRGAARERLDDAIERGVP